MRIEREGRGGERSGEERKLFHVLITTDHLKGRMGPKLRVHKMYVPQVVDSI